MTDDERQAALAAAFARPLEDPLERWRREAPPGQREGGLDTRPQPDWAAIDERLPPRWRSGRVLILRPQDRRLPRFGSIAVDESDSL